MTLINFFVANFITISFGIIGISFLISFVLIMRKTDIKLQLGNALMLLVILILLFWIKLSQDDVKTYSYLLPLSHLIIVVLSELLLFNSIKRYQNSYSKIEYRLIYFYLINFLVWFIIFLQDIFTIGNENIDELQILPILGLLLLNLSIGAAITIFYIGKSIFYPNYKLERLLDNFIFVFFGVTIGITFADLNRSIYIDSERYYQQTFVFPNIFRPYGIIIVLFLFIPYVLMAYQSRTARNLLIESKIHGGSIDPVAIPRLKMIELSMYVYLLGAGAAILLTILPGLGYDLTFGFGLNTLLSVPFIAIVDVNIYLAFQTPDWLKNKWRIAEKMRTTVLS